MPDVVRDLVIRPWFWLVVVAVLVGLAYSVQRMPSLSRPGPRSEQAAVCAWCVWRAGDMGNGRWALPSLCAGLSRRAVDRRR
jgi:hypothetical protein